MREKKDSGVTQFSPWTNKWMETQVQEHSPAIDGKVSDFCLPVASFLYIVLIFLNYQVTCVVGQWFLNGDNVEYCMECSFHTIYF